MNGRNISSVIHNDPVLRWHSVCKMIGHRQKHITFRLDMGYIDFSVNRRKTKEFPKIVSLISHISPQFHHAHNHRFLQHHTYIRTIVKSHHKKTINGVQSIRFTGSGCIINPGINILGNLIGDSPNYLLRLFFIPFHMYILDKKFLLINRFQNKSHIAVSLTTAPCLIYAGHHAYKIFLT